MPPQLCWLSLHSVSMYMHRGCVQPRARHVRLNWRRRRWENGRSQGGGDDAKYISRLTRTPPSLSPVVVPTRPWRRRDTPGRVSSAGKSDARFSKTPISRTKHYPTTQNRSTGCVRTERRDGLRAWFVRRGRCRLAVSCTRHQADLWILKKSTVTRRKARQPDGRTRRSSLVEGDKERDGSADWRIWDRRDPGGHTELSETRGVRVDARGWPTPPTSLTPPSRVGPPPSLLFHLLHHPGLLQSRRRATHTKPRPRAPDYLYRLYTSKKNHPYSQVTWSVPRLKRNCRHPSSHPFDCATMPSLMFRPKEWKDSTVKFKGSHCHCKFKFILRMFHVSCFSQKPHRQ